jgi:hypothetical protein
MKLVTCFIFLATYSSYAQSTEVKGLIQSKTGSVITIAMAKSPAQKGDKLKLLKYKEGKIGNLPFSAWIDIADVEVISNADDKVVLSVLKENSVVFIDGKKKDQFTKDAEVKLEKPGSGK